MDMYILFRALNSDEKADLRKLLEEDGVGELLYIKHGVSLEEDKLFSKYRPIDGIKAIRARTGLSLKESKALADYYRSHM